MICRHFCILIRKSVAEIWRLSKFRGFLKNKNCRHNRRLLEFGSGRRNNRDQRQGGLRTELRFSNPLFARGKILYIVEKSVLGFFERMSVLIMMPNSHLFRKGVTFRKVHPHGVLKNKLELNIFVLVHPDEDHPAKSTTERRHRNF